MNKAHPSGAPAIDWPMFATTVATIALACVPIVLAPREAAQFISELYDLLTGHFSLLYQWYAIGAMAFLLYIAFSRHGRIRLGGTGSVPEFPTLTWIVMIFCAGVGAGLLYWAIIEWAYYIDAPPLGYAARSPEAIEWAATYGIFHWGPTGWAILCLPGVAIAYAFHCRNVPRLRLSTGCMPFLPQGTASPRGRALDFLYMVNLIGGTGTSLGLVTPMIAAVFAEFAGIEHDFALEVGVMLVSIAIFGTSAWLGLERGFRRLADLNLWAVMVLLLFVLAVGPTLFLLKMGTNSIGLVLQNFLRMNTWTDPVRNTGFIEDWTIFYWAWWTAYAPFVGIFVTRISRGRSLRELILGMLMFGSLGGAVFYVVFGNYAMHLELSGLLPVTELMRQHSEAYAIAQVFASLPFSELALAAFLVIAMILLATTYDSASYTLASVSSREMHAGENPARWSRVFWACALGVLPVTLIFVEGGIKVVLSATIVVSLPLLAVGVLLAISLLRMLREDEVLLEPSGPG